LRENERINRERELKKSEKERLSADLVVFQEELDVVKQTKAEESVDLYVIQAKVDRTKNKVLTLDQEIELLNAKRDLGTVKVRRKEQQANSIDVRYKLRIGRVDVEEWLVAFRNQKELSRSGIKVLDDKRNASINFSIERSRALEMFRSRKQTVAEKKGLFKGKSHQQQEVLTYLNEVISQISKQQRVISQYQRINSDLIHIHNEIIDQSDFIITELESQVLALSIWKRSPQAISFLGFNQSLLDAEIFAKRFFWETPDRVSPGALIKALKQATWRDFFGLCIFLLLFFLLFFSLRWLLFYLKQRIVDWLTLSAHRRTSMYFSALDSFVEYISDNYSFIFTWFYFFIALTAARNYMPHALRFLKLPYFMAVFYFLSIPVLVYLARQLLDCLKKLNQKLSFLFFTEKFQNKFIFFDYHCVVCDVDFNSLTFSLFTLH